MFNFKQQLDTTVNIIKRRYTDGNIEAALHGVLYIEAMLIHRREGFSQLERDTNLAQLWPLKRELQTRLGRPVHIS